MFLQARFYNLATDKYQGRLAGVAKFFLYLASLIYGLIVRLSSFVYNLKPYGLNCRVISVGNITLGGTGKTSAVIFIAKYLKTQGRKVAILSRGYKRMTKTIGDEPYMLKTVLKDVPVIVDADRIRSAKKAIQDYMVDTVILDDGFQQWRIRKNLEIVAIDAASPFGNGKLIPAGILREPLTALKRADVFILTKADLNPANQKTKDFLARINPDAIILESIHRPLGFYKMDKPQEGLDIDALRGKTVTLFSGIGDPDSFENLIKSLGIRIGLSFRFRDHHNYSQKDLGKIIKDSQEENIDTIITTEKDAARLYELRITNYKLRILVLRIELKIIQDEERFYRRLLSLYPH